MRLGAENTLENRVHMFGVVAQIELFFDFCWRQGGRYFRICQKLGFEIRAM